MAAGATGRVGRLWLQISSLPKVDGICCLQQLGVERLDEACNTAAAWFFMPPHRLAGDDAATTLSLLDFPETDVTRSGA